MQWRHATARVTHTEDDIAFRLTGTGFSGVLLPLLPVWLSLVQTAGGQDVLLGMRHDVIPCVMLQSRLRQPITLTPPPELPAGRGSAKVVTFT